ncbi:Spo0E family sporulation regulatory protein-aspartic acid phosphatase [Neobacillus niacini]
MNNEETLRYSQRLDELISTYQKLKMGSGANT